MSADRRVRYQPFDDEWWVRCDQGHVHYGEHGAAGLLLRRRYQDRWLYLLQQRATWVDHGGTWSFASGALHSGERPEHGALREAREEGVKVDLDWLVSDPSPRVLVDDHGGWAFHTVLATVHPDVLPTVSETSESVRSEWLDLEHLPPAMTLHPGFQKLLDTYQETLVR